MKTDEAQNNELFKEMVKQRFGLTPEHQRREFGKIKTRPEETYSQLPCRLD